MFKKNLCIVLWLGILNLPLALYSAKSYAPILILALGLLVLPMVQLHLAIIFFTLL